MTLSPPKAGSLPEVKASVRGQRSLRLQRGQASDGTNMKIRGHSIQLVDSGNISEDTLVSCAPVHQIHTPANTAHTHTHLHIGKSNPNAISNGSVRKMKYLYKKRAAFNPEASSHRKWILSACVCVFVVIMCTNDLL